MSVAGAGREHDCVPPDTGSPPDFHRLDSLPVLPAVGECLSGRLETVLLAEAGDEGVTQARLGVGREGREPLPDIRCRLHNSPHTIERHRSPDRATRGFPLTATTM